jgi:hypothetical protein
MGGIKSGKEAGRGTAAGEAEFSLLRGAEGRGGQAGGRDVSCLSVVLARASMTTLASCGEIYRRG